MTNQIVFDVFPMPFVLREILHTDASLIDTLKQKRSKLPPMHIGRYGQLQSGSMMWMIPMITTAMYLILYGLFPSNQVARIARRNYTALQKIHCCNGGDVSTGWSMGWKVNWWAKCSTATMRINSYKTSNTRGTNEGGGGTIIICLMRIRHFRLMEILVARVALPKCSCRVRTANCMYCPHCPMHGSRAACRAYVRGAALSLGS